MLCHLCGKNTATTHVKTIINGELSEWALCAPCAMKMGYGGLFSDFAGAVGLLSRPGRQEERCPYCGCSFDEIARAGRVGCAQCYAFFYDRLQPALQRIHGSAAYCGKTPGAGLLQLRRETSLSVMREQLREAIDTENFEDAAVIRDRIRALEGGQSE